MNNYRVGLQEIETGQKLNIWASSLSHCSLRLFKNRSATEVSQKISMQREEDGFFSAVFPFDVDEICYDLELPCGLCVPDPFADENIGGVHGRSISFSPGKERRRDASEIWQGVPISKATILEVHVGTFTKEGTFRALLEKLGALKESGITTIQLMPITLVPGDRNWGYDPVSFFTLNPKYGSSSELHNLIECAHQKGIAVILDVVFNHLGPEGNYFSLISKDVFDARQRTPWGNAISIEGESAEIVQNIILQSIEKWMSRFGFDGIRVDAGEYLRSFENCDLLKAIANAARESCWHENPLLILEHDLAQLSETDRDILFSEGGYNLLWNHALIQTPAMAGEGMALVHRVFADHATDPKSVFSLENPLRSAKKCPAYVNFLRSHDTIGNAGFAFRNEGIETLDWLDALPLLLLMPSVPMIFMGDEWMCDTPFHFFCDLQDTSQADLVAARSREFGNQRLLNSQPMEEAAFTGATIDWNSRDENAFIRHYFEKLSEIRQHYIAPLLEGKSSRVQQWRSVCGHAFAIRWLCENGYWLTILCTARQGHGVITPDFGTQIFFSDAEIGSRDGGFSTALYRSGSVKSDE